MAKTLVYELYPPAWPGGLKQMTEHLKRIAALGCVDYVWLAPIYPSPGYDHGYDIANYVDVDSRYGTLADLAQFVEHAHKLGLKVLMDLVLNHTSTKHEWFKSSPSYYCWSNRDYPKWHNLFDEGPAWEWNEDCMANGHHLFYCHLFHKKQADLNWFPDGQHINENLVMEFRDIVDFWMNEYGVDGFRLDVPQSINKDLTNESLELNDLLRGEKSCQVINAIFTGEDAPTTQSCEKPFLMVELLDPSFGDIVKMYGEKVPVVDFCLNILVKDLTDKSFGDYSWAVTKSCALSNFMLDLESHDSTRILSRWLLAGRPWVSGMATAMLTHDDPEGICVFQGQELGLRNPNAKELPDKMMLELDAQTKMRYEKGVSLTVLRHASRANARVPIPLDKYTSDNRRLKRFSKVLKDWKDGKKTK